MYNKLWKRNIHDSCNVKQMQMHNIQRTYNICTTNYGNEIYKIHVMLNKCITYNAPTIYVQQTMETKYTLRHKFLWDLNFSV